MPSPFKWQKDEAEKGSLNQKHKDKVMKELPDFYQIQTEDNL